MHTIYFNEAQSDDLQIPYYQFPNRKTVMHTETLNRISHADAGMYEPSELRLTAGVSPGWWFITSEVKLAAATEKEVSHV